MRWRTRIAALTLLVGALLALASAGAWALASAGGAAWLRFSGGVSLGWCLAIVAISLLLALPRRPFVGIFGTIGGAWIAGYASELAGGPMVDMPRVFGNFWFVLPVAGIPVAGLSGLAHASRLRWFGRGIATLWLLGSVAWLLRTRSSTFPTSVDDGIVAIAIQWVGLLAFGPWAAWLALELIRGRVAERSRRRWFVDTPTTDDYRRARTPYGRWPPRFAYLAAISAALSAFTLAIDRVGQQADLGADIVEAAFGVGVASLAFILGRTTPRLGANRFRWAASIPHLGIVFGLTEAGVLGGFVLTTDGDISGTPERVVLLIGLGVIGWWALRVAARQRSSARRRGLLGGAGLMVTSFVAAGLDNLPAIRDLSALIVALPLGLLATWLWQLAAELQGGVARPASVFKLPGIEPLPALPPHAERPTSIVPAPAFGPGAMSPTRFGVAELARRMGLTVEELQAARPVYRTVHVRKRAGGTRTLLVPDAATKALQRRLLRRVLGRVPVHPAAHGFERGRSIVSNAAMHAGRRVVVKMDVVDFFGSTSARRVRRLYRVLGWDAEAADILMRWTTQEGGLPAGAPTSPRVANLVNVQLDARLARLAVALGATYTRYADDLTFSFYADDHAALADLLGATRRIAKQHGYRLHVERKLQIRRRHHRQVVTGLVVNQRVALPRVRRRWLRAVEHRIYAGGEATINREQLRGWQAFESMVVAVPPDRDGIRT